jgi:hypothetical protein
VDSNLFRALKRTLIIPGVLFEHGCTSHAAIHPFRVSILSKKVLRLLEDESHLADSL